ncbi:MAG: STAS/SEC14 domain-containing protein [Tateyamaria sp.]|uniref:STAS/SEC14 domain-containing protein n=1 Tax=Tateyamaria sp. TaxID=1929288 RepID=UPI0032DCDA55
MKLDLRNRENIMVISPEQAISKEDIDGLVAAMNGYINEYDKVPSLVIKTDSAPMWDSFDALKSHLSFVHDRHKIVLKVAFVTDSVLLSLARPLADVFTAAKIRRFKSEALEDALNWAAMEEDHPGAITQMEGFPRDVIALRFSGLITSQDYSNSLVPLIDEAAKEHDKLKLLCVLDQYFDGYSAGAVWDDMRFGFSHFTTFSKLALVTDIDWIRKSAKLFGGLMPTEVMVFDNDEFEDAKAWIRT